MIVPPVHELAPAMARAGRRAAWVALLVALLVTLLVTLGGCASTGRPATSDDGPQSPTAPTPAEARGEDGWLSTIPDSVDIAAGIHAGRNGEVSAQSRKVDQARLLGIPCPDPPDLHVGSLDRLGVAAPDYPDDARTLYLYPDASRARERFHAVQDWLDPCHGTECCTARRWPSHLGDQSLLEVTTDVGTGAGPTGRWLRLIRVGNAVLLTDSDDDFLTGPRLARDVRRQGAALAPVIEDMDVFRRTRSGPYSCRRPSAAKLSTVGGRSRQERTPARPSRPC